MPTALIVEDEAIIALDLASELRALGLDILGLAKTYEQAMEIAARTLPDIAIVDLVLNGMSHGAKIATVLRARGVRVLITSGSEHPPAHADMAFLPKPWGRDELVRALDLLPATAG
jgi:CheY-like chemotaxis protein